MKSSAALALRAVLVGVACQAAIALAEDDSLHVLVDRHLAATEPLQPGICSDAEFLRRASLDLTGRPPGADEVRAFLADTSPDKREQLIDRLLASPHYARHLATVFDVQLMERRANPHVNQDEWHAWLLSSFRENKPWNVMVREILTADGFDVAARAPARFYLDRDSEPNLLVRDLSRTLFGRDIQCAQCHDHPLVDDYRQADYHGLLAFVSPGYAQVIKEGDKQRTVYAERAGDDLQFESVFVKGTPHRTGAKLPYGLTIDEPFYLPGQEYSVAPADNVRAVPHFSRRAKLAELVTGGQYRPFNENIANRLWAVLMGRGLVHPLDFHHPDNPPVDPELMALLGQRFAAMNFDVRGFLRELALTRVYQRSIDLPAEIVASSATAASRLASLEQQRETLKQQADASYAAYNDVLAKRQEAEAAVIPVAGELSTARNKYAEARKKLDEAAAAHQTAVAQVDARKQTAGIVRQAATAGQQAAEKLPEDKELAAAAAKFAERAAQLDTEVAAAQKVADEKQAALQAPTEALQVAQAAVDEVKTRLDPLNAALLAIDEPLQSARRQMAQDSERLVAIKRRIEQLEKLDKLHQIQPQWDAARTELAQRDAEYSPLAAQLNQAEAQFAAAEQAMQVAGESLAAATTRLQEITAQHNRMVQQAQLVATAAEAAEAARILAPADAEIVAAATGLKQRAATLQSAMGELLKQKDEATAAHKAADTMAQTATTNLARMRDQLTAVQAPAAAAQQALAVARDRFAGPDAVRSAILDELTESWARDFTIASFKPLSPEQLCWSIFQITGVYDRYWQAEVAELDKTSPLTDEQKQDPQQVAARNLVLEQKTYDKLKGNVGVFVQYYGAGAGQPQGDFFATADQALFAANAGQINGWVVPAADNVTERIIKSTEPQVAAEELYLAVLTRMPTPVEVQEVAGYLQTREADRAVAAQELVWSLLNSAEFRFNH